MKELLIGIGVALGILSAIVGGFLIVETVRDYNPPDVVELQINGNAVRNEAQTLSLLTWNIGYAGLGKEMDFFFDGGKRSKPEKEYVLKYFKGIKNFLDNYRADVILLQEIDVDSDRSYHINQVEEVAKMFEDEYDWVFAINYLMDFIPVPINNPLGKVYSGQMTLSKYRILEAKRFKLPGEYPWPQKLAFLDRCFIYTKIKAKDGKYWVIINTHNSAYDENGEQRKLQLEFIKKFMIEEYKKGNYVIVGGDWNNILPGIEKNHFKTKSEPSEFYVQMPKDWTPKGWQWAFDPSVPTNRLNDKPYKPGDNYVTIIDGFLVSPNVEIVEVKGINLNFENSDHNPVFLRVKIKEK